MKKSTVILLLGFSLIFVGLIVFLIYSIAEPGVSFGKKVALVELEGVIVDSRDIVRQFKKYRDDDAVKAIVFRVESPGGGITPSQEIFDMVKKTRAVKPVVVSMGSVAASGGYYVSCPADLIVANPGTITGSIGVIIQYPNVDKLLEKIGVNFTTIKSGKFKDAMSPYRDMTKEETNYLQGFVMNAYEQFVQAVADERKLDTGYVKQYADGRVYTGQQAKEYKLVDELGTYEDAIRIAGEKAGIEGVPQTVRERKRKPSLFELMFDDDAKAQVESVLPWPEFKSYPVVSYKYGI